MTVRVHYLLPQSCTLIASLGKEGTAGLTSFCPHLPASCTASRSCGLSQSRGGISKSTLLLLLTRQAVVINFLRLFHIGMDLILGKGEKTNKYIFFRPY